MSVNFTDNSIHFKNKMKDLCLAFLEEAGGEIESKTKRNCAVVTGRTKGSFTHRLDEGNFSCSIGSDYENAIWEEFGTGIYAVNGNGRRTAWVYKDEHGKGHFTRGKRPKRMMFKAYASSRSLIESKAKEKFGELK